MILVMEAGYQGWVAFSAASTLPVSASTRIRASARTGDADRVMAVQVIAQVAANAKPNVDGREIIRFAVPDRCYWYKKAEGIPKPPATPRLRGRQTGFVHRRPVRKQNLERVS